MAAPKTPAANQQLRVATAAPGADFDLESTGKEQQEYDSEEGLPQLPGKSPHYCTDVACGIFFLLAWAGLIPIALYAWQNAHFSKFARGFDYQRRLCGRDDCAPGVTCGEFLFYCRLPNGQVDFYHPVCKDECPNSSLTYTSCVNGTTATEILLPDYPSLQYNSKCLGFKQNGEEKDVTPEFAPHMEGVAWTGQAFDILGSIADARYTFIATLLSCTAFGYVYLLFLKLFSTLVLYTSVMLMIVLPFAAAAWDTWNVYSEGLGAVIESLDGKERLAIIVCLFVVGGVFAKVYCAMKEGFETAAACLEAACECIWDMPSLLLQPVVQLIANFGAVVASVFLCLSLVTAGRIVLVEGVEGQYRTIQFAPEQIAYLSYATFICFWILMCGHCQAQYVLAYLAQRWYFTPYQGDSKQVEGSFLFCEACYNCNRFHFGSCCLGSFLRVVGFVPWMLLGVTKFLPECCGTNAENESLATGYSAFYKFQALLRKSTWMQISATSHDYFTAAPIGMDVLDDLDSALAILDGAIFVFKSAGVGMQMAIAFVLSRWQVSQPTYTDPHSSQFLPNPNAVVVAHMAMAGITAFWFLNVFDMPSDTILYCVALEEKRWKVKAERYSQAGVSVTRDCWAYSGIGWLMGYGNQEDHHDIDTGVQYAPDSLLKILVDDDNG